MSDIPAPSTIARLRSGTAARLAGLPVTTLRVWERRYAVVAAPKTATGQRLYSTLDVQRLGLLRQLTERGHAIGTIAALPLDELRSLAAGLPPEALPTRQVSVVGRAAAQRLRTVPGCVLQAVFDDTAAAETAPAMSVDVLLVQLPSLQPADTRRLPALRDRFGAATLIVLYAFGAEPLADALRASGAVVLREPASGRELVRLVCGSPAAAQVPDVALPAMAPRRFSDETLAALAEHPSSVACECPRHVAEIVMQLASFERYSADCLSRSPADAALHRQLSALAGSARAQFEQALANVMAEEGISLPA